MVDTLPQEDDAGPFNIINAPEEELNRSTAASRVGALAHASGLFLSHFERRHHLELPEAWLAQDRIDLLGQAHWHRGKRVEPKYSYFRYDSPLGSFHPSHRAKWTAHELCHGLVGFAWAPGKSRFFHHAAARLSEVLPVALWYFFDEADVNRCAIHKHQGMLFGDLCWDCEKAALVPPRGKVDEALMHAGEEFVRAEIDAVERSIKTGKMYEHHYGTLNLARDGAAWAAAHHMRLVDPEYARFRELFLNHHTGYFSDLESLRDRVLSVMDHLTGKAKVEPWQAESSTWIVHDIADRIFTIQKDCEDEVAKHLWRIIESMASTPNSAAIELALDHYTELYEHYYIPPPEHVFGLGYTVSSFYGNCIESVMDGLKSGAPETSKKLGEKLNELTRTFIQVATVRRQHITEGFFTAIQNQLSEFDRDLLMYESAMFNPKALDFESVHFSVGPRSATERLEKTSQDPNREYRLARDITFLELNHDIRRFLAGESETETRCEEPLFLAMRPTVDGDVIALDLDRIDAQNLRHSMEVGHSLLRSDVSESAFEALSNLGYLVPAAWN